VDPKQAVHVVRKGETLEKIALEYYRTRDGIAWIAEANSLRDVNRISANDKLIIPARKEMRRDGAPESGGTARGSSSRPPPSTTRIPSVYVVKKGENLYAICRRFYGSRGEGARVARIMEINDLWSADVRAGTKLRLPPE
jgi:nucleoid-associated protein YgaU